MAETLAAGRPPPELADRLAHALGRPAQVALVERRPGFDLYRARLVAGGRLVVKHGPLARMAHEAACLRRAGDLVGALAPRLVALVPCGDGRALLAMEDVPGAPLQPGRLSTRAWRALFAGLVRLHGQGPAAPARCWPLAEDALDLGDAEPRAVSVAGLRPLLAAALQAVPDLDTGAGLRLLDALAADVHAHPGVFQRPPRYVHADVWPENVLVRQSSCWLVDWSWLKAADYALDLANLKLVLAWVWPPWQAHGTFERVLRHYAHAFGDPGLAERLRVYAPLVSLVHLVQFGRGGCDDPANAGAMRVCLATARRDRALWGLAGPRRRLAYALLHRVPSEYGVDGTRA